MKIKMKNIFLTIILILSVSVIFFGIKEVIEHSVERDDIRVYGMPSVVEVDTVWRQRCGSGYGNKILFSLPVKDSVYILESKCNIPSHIKKGDYLEVKYLESNPNMFELQFPPVP